MKNGFSAKNVNTDDDQLSFGGVINWLFENNKKLLY